MTTETVPNAQRVVAQTPTYSLLNDGGEAGCAFGEAALYHDCGRQREGWSHLLPWP